MIKFLDLQSQYKQIKLEIDEAIFSVISNGDFIGGDAVRTFEKNFSTYCNTDHCIGVANGTDALEIAIEALDLPLGSDILVPANSFIASAEAVTRNGHNVVFVDCDPRNYTISVESVERRITDKTSAVIAVHLYGHPCDIDALRSLIGPNIKIIEDCAQAHGAEYKAKRVGSLGDIAAFSFYPGKNLGAYGDAGAITTNDADLAIKCRKIANHGRIEKYNHEMVGRNSRLDTIQAAILNVKFSYLDEWTSRRIEIATKYKSALQCIDNLILPFQESWAKPVFHLFVVQIDNREELQRYLNAKGIQTGVHYPIALPKLKAYEKQYDKTIELHANTIDNKVLSLPIGDQLNDDEVAQIIDTITAYLSKNI